MLGAVEVTTTDFAKQKPVTDAVFQVYKEQFSYDKKDLNARVEWRNQSSAEWVQERVVVDAAYGNEKLALYLFLPRRISPPYQTVIYLPGSGSVMYTSSKELDRFFEFEWFLSPLVKNGRAVIYPVYKSTFEIQDPSVTPIHYAEPTPVRQYTEYVIHVIKDFMVCVDYLETRSDIIDAKRLVYLGFSWGGYLGPIALAVDGRPITGILLVGGRWGESRPEVDVANYWPRVRVPTLMLNGKHDTTFDFDTVVKPMFDLLGTPAAHKRLIVYDTAHFVPRNEYIKETPALARPLPWARAGATLVLSLACG